MKVSIFRNFNEVVAQKNFTEIAEIILTGVFRKQVEQLQTVLKEKGTKEYNNRKKDLPAFTPSGRFEGGRKAEFLKAYSNLIILDIDKLDTKILEVVRKKILSCEYTYCCFKSPSGMGLKIIVKVGSGLEKHKEAFNHLKLYYEKLLDIEIDPSGKDATRLCFFSYDPELYINATASVFKLMTDKSVINNVEKLIEKIEGNRLDITSGYEDWRNIGFALESEFGENGRSYYHTISKYNPQYSPEICNEQFTKCLDNNNSGITLKTLFHIAKQHGITVSSNGKTDNTFQPPKTSKEGKSNPHRKVTTNKFILAKEYLESQYEIRSNIVSNEFEYKEKGDKDFKPLNENSIYIKMQLDNVTLSLNNLVALLKSELFQQFNPFWNYFESLLKWDQKTDHIKHLASYVKVAEKDRQRFDNHFKKWIVRTAKCALIDEYFNKQAFILVHDKQNSGKSTFCRFLCPPKLNNYIAENLSIDKDSRILLTTNMIINLDELSTLSKVEINSLKSLFSKDKINDRLPYDRKNSIIPRRASFIGSTNQMEFLNDESGSVRWLCFVIEEIDWNYSKDINIDNVYAQAFHLFKVGYKCDLTPEEIRENEEANKRFQITTSERELIQKYLSQGSNEDHEKFMTATDILMHLNEKVGHGIRMNKVNVGKSLKFLGYDRIKHSTQKIYGYYINFIDPFL